MTLTPRPYQIAGRDFLASRRHALLADEMRVGKTPQAILAAHKAGAQSLLVTCPAIAVPQWEREIIRWWPGDQLPAYNVWSYDKARMFWQNGTRPKADVYIPDECHFAKNPEAARTRMVYGKEGFAWFAQATWALSGTPAPKHAGELWCMLKAFGVVGCTYDEFLRQYCRIDWMSQRPVGTLEEKIPELQALLAKVMLRRKRVEVAPEMPGIDFQFLPVEPTERVDLRVGDRMGDEELLDALERYSDSNKEDRQAVAMAKVRPLVEHIAFAFHNNLLRQTVVFGWHVEPLKALVHALAKEGIKFGLLNGQTTPRGKVEIQQAFHDGRLDGVAANIITAGTAIDLSPARHGYFLELDWVPGNNLQAANRMVSMEMKDAVTIDVATWPGSHDDRVQRVLMRRVAELNQLL